MTSACPPKPSSIPVTHIYIKQMDRNNTIKEIHLHVYMQACMHIHKSMYASIFLSRLTCMNMQVCSHVTHTSYTYIHTYTYYKCTYACTTCTTPVCLGKYVHTYIYYRHTYAWVHGLITQSIYLGMQACMNLYVCGYVYTYMYYLMPLTGSIIM